MPTHYSGKLSLLGLKLHRPVYGFQQSTVQQYVYTLFGQVVTIRVNVAQGQSTEQYVHTHCSDKIKPCPRQDKNERGARRYGENSSCRLIVVIFPLHMCVCVWGWGRITPPPPPSHTTGHEDCNFDSRHPTGKSTFIRQIPYWKIRVTRLKQTVK